jgi:hypothetical protein
VDDNVGVGLENQQVGAISSYLMLTGMETVERVEADVFCVLPRHVITATMRVLLERRNQHVHNKKTSISMSIQGVSHHEMQSRPCDKTVRTW